MKPLNSKDCVRLRWLLEDYDDYVNLEREYQGH